MRGVPFGVGSNGLLQVEAAAPEDLWRVVAHAPTTTTGVANKEAFEPRSVLEPGSSPSPPTSASTLSSSLGGGGGDVAGLAGEAWGAPDQSLLRWVMGEIAADFEAGDGGGGLGTLDPGSMAAPPPLASSSPGEFSVVEGDNGDGDGGGMVLPILPSPGPVAPPPGVAFQELVMDEKPHGFGPNLVLSPQQQVDLLPPPPKRHHSMAVHRNQIPNAVVPFCDTGQDPFPWRCHQQQRLDIFHALPYHPKQLPMKPKVGGDEEALAVRYQQLLQRQEEEALVDQLFEAAVLVETGNFADAGVVLARLNHQASLAGKPLVRSAFYCKEALQSIIASNSNGRPPSTSLRNPSMALSAPLDVVLKLSAYKAFSELSPISQFTDFTCTQALLEELNGCNRIHIIDFDVGIGGQWSSFMEELALRRRGVAATTPSLKITAIASLGSHHCFELGLARENLSHFAGGLGIPFEFNILNSDPLDLSSLLNMLQSGEAIAVNLPVSSAYPSIESILHIVKQLSPKILVSVDHGWDHNGLMFSHHLLHLLQSATILLDSIDATGISPAVASKIERYLLQPRIENAVLGHHHATVKGFCWRTLFASAGFTAVPFSSFTEAQAECLLKRTQVKGFLLEKRQASFLLCWHRGVLVSVSAWKC